MSADLPPDNTKKERLQSILASFENPGEKIPVFGSDEYRKISITTSVPNAHLLKHILVDTLGFPCSLMPMEKILWEISFLFNGVPCVVASQKFGDRLYINSKDEKEISEMTERIVSAFNEATSYLHSLLKGYAKLEIPKGNILVTNEYGRMRAMYEYFKTKSLEQLKAAETRVEGAQNPIEGWNESVVKKREAFFLEQAAYFAFFGLLEHLLVLFLAFKDFNPATDDFNGFLFKSWSKKYKRVFDLTNDAMALKYHKVFEEIAKRHRNPHAHGMITGDGRSIFFHLEGTGLLSALLSDSPFPGPLEWLAGNGGNFENLDNFLIELKEHQFYKIPMQIIESGLDISFSEQERGRYADLIEAGDASDYIEYQIEMSDRNENMDW